MISPNKFYEELKKNGINFFTGVPDSSLKHLCAYITDNTNKKNHIIVANEGNAIALAAGKYLATQNIPLVYMQNSGQGNAINPLTSLMDSDVYSLPVLMLIGWRGEPGKKDEPQHVKQGKITLKILETLEIPYEVLPENIEEAKLTIEKAFQYMNAHHAPYAIVIKKGSFEEYKLQNKIDSNYEMSRESAIKILTNNLDINDIVISTTGKTSRELFEYREELNQGHEKDFLTVGSMGHSSSIALGIALSKPERNVYCFDGDGALIMHLGASAIIGQNAPSNFKHIILNNGAHDSVGGQPTVGFQIDIQKMAQACKYKETFEEKTEEELKIMINKLKNANGPALLEIKVKKGARKELGRPTKTPQENKKDFIKFLK